MRPIEVKGLLPLAWGEATGKLMMNVWKGHKGEDLRLKEHGPKSEVPVFHMIQKA